MIFYYGSILFMAESSNNIEHEPTFTKNILTAGID